MDDVELSGLQDFEVGCLRLEDEGELEEWLAWVPTEGFDIDGLICSGDEDHGSEVTEIDHAKGLSSEFCAYEGLLINSSTPTSSHNNTNILDINNQNLQEDMLTVPQRESNCQAQELAQGSAVKSSCEEDILIPQRESNCQVQVLAQGSATKSSYENPDSNLQEDILTVPQRESNCQAQELAQGSVVKSSWENPDSNLQKDILTVSHRESNFQVQELAQGSAIKSSCENPDSKRALRLIKNREAASQSRKKKKSYVQDLESKCRMWENYCNQLKQSIAFTCTENTVLRDELSRFKRQKGCNGVAEPAVPKDSLPSESPSHLTTLAVAGHLIGIRCLGWLLVALILLLLGEAVKPSVTNGTTFTKNGRKSSTFWVFINLYQKRSVFESYPGTRSRALSSCRHRYGKLNKVL